MSYMTAAKTTPKSATKVAKKTSKATESTEQNFIRRQFHAIIGILYFIQAGLVFLLAKTETVSVYASFLNKDTLASGAQGKEVISGAMQQVAEFNLAYVVFIMLLTAALTHGLLASLARRDSWPEKARVWHERRLRWIGLGLSLIITTILVALVIGVREAGALTLLATLTAVSVAAAYILEVPQRLSRRITNGVVLLSVIVPWVVLTASVLYSTINGVMPFENMLVYLVAIVFTGLLFSGLYSFWRQGKFAQVEMIVFSSVVIFISQSAIAWQIFAGLLRA